MPLDPSKSLTERYDRQASAYRDLWAPILLGASRRLLPEFPSSQVRRILDVGTGVGSLLPDLARTFPGAFILGIDRSRGMLALAPAEFPLAVMDARHLAVATGSVDLVLALFVVFHLERPLEGLREARRVLRSGGACGTLTWAGDVESPASRVWAECLDAHGAAAVDPAGAARHEPLNTPAKMESLLSAAGFPTARSWEMEVITRIDLEHLVRLRTNVGSEKVRFDSFTESVRSAFLVDVRRRLEALAPEDFVARGGVICAVATA